MTRFPRLARLLFIGLLFVVAGLLAGCGRDPSTEPHSHGGDHEGEHTHGSGSAVTAWSDVVEVFAEHPSMVAGQRSDPWAIHVTALDGFRPVDEGTLTLRFRRPDGAAYVHSVDAPSRPGIFTPQPEIPEPGTFRLFAIVESPPVRDTIDVGDVTVHPDGDVHASAPSESEISFPKEQQWTIDFGTAAARVASVRSSIVASGEIRPVPGRFAHVAAPVSGLTPARANLDMPAPGDRVREGQPLAILTPSGGETSYADVKARVARLKREVARAERLYDVEAIPEKQLVEARHDLEVARASLASIGGTDDGGFDYTLRAPIGGRVHERHLVPGSRVEVGTALYSIVDPSRVWIHLRVPSDHADRLDDVQGGAFSVEGSDRRYVADRVVSVEAALDANTRTVSVRLSAANSDERLKIGMLVQAHLFVGDAQSGVAIPNDAIQTEDGEPVAYVQVSGEGFERRPLRLGPSDGATTLVERGVERGERVVTQGAYQVYLASLNTAEVGGHGHPH